MCYSASLGSHFVQMKMCPSFVMSLCIESVAAVFIYIFQDSAVGIVTDKNIMKIIADVACQHRTAYIHFPGFWIINKIIRVRHNGIMKNSLTGFYSFFDSSAAVIFPFPFVTVQCGFTENGINQLWVITSTKCNHGAKGKIRFRSTLKFCDIPSIIKTDKFFAILSLRRLHMISIPM